MRAVTRIEKNTGKWDEVTITGPEIVCIPVIKYLVLLAVNEKRTMVINFYEEEEDE